MSKSTKPSYELKPVKEIPARACSKKSKYDYILDAFLESKEKTSQVAVPNKTPNYVRNSLAKRIAVRNQVHLMDASCINGETYLELKDQSKKPEPTKKPEPEKKTEPTKKAE